MVKPELAKLFCLRLFVGGSTELTLLLRTDWLNFEADNWTTLRFEPSTTSS